MGFILGLSGKKGGGKDTLCNFLIRNTTELFDYVKVETRSYGDIRTCPNVMRFACADPMKHFCVEFLGLSHNQCWGSLDEKHSLTKLTWRQMINVDTLLKDGTIKEEQLDEFLTARQVLQQVGTNWFRKIDEDIWCKKLIKSIEDSSSDYAIVADVRYPNEIEYIRKAGGSIIRLTRLVETDDPHPSETALDDYKDFDATIDNSQMSISQSEQELVNVLEKWGWTKQNKLSVN